MDHVKSRLVTLKEKVTTVGYAVTQHSRCAEMCIRNSPAEMYFFSGSFRLFNPLNAKLNPICHLLALLGAHHILHISRERVKFYWNYYYFFLNRYHM